MDREDLPAAERQIYARSGINLWGLHVVSSRSRCERRSFHSTKGIYVRKARVVIQQMTDRRGVFFSLHVTPPLWGCGTPYLGWGNFPSWRDFPFERTNQSAFIFTGPQAQIPLSPYQQGLGLVRGYLMLCHTFLRVAQGNQSMRNLSIQKVMTHCSRVNPPTRATSSFFFCPSIHSPVHKPTG